MTTRKHLGVSREQRLSGILCAQNAIFLTEQMAYLQTLKDMDKAELSKVGKAKDGGTRLETSLHNALKMSSSMAQLRANSMDMECHTFIDINKAMGPLMDVIHNDGDWATIPLLAKESLESINQQLLDALMTLEREIP